MVIWITGISGAGKTTLCEVLRHKLKPRLPQLVLLDGDVIREIFGNDLGFTEPDRVRQIKRIQSIARELDRQGLIVLVAALYAHPQLLDWNRRNFDDYFEVYLDAPVALVQRRDPKGLYAKVARGEMKDVVGLDVPWHVPTSPDLRVEMGSAGSPEEVAIDIARRIPRLAIAIDESTKGGGA